jgi:hypothetical protein
MHTHNPLWFAQKHSKMSIVHNGKVWNPIFYVMGDPKTKKLLTNCVAKSTLNGLFFHKN